MRGHQTSQFSHSCHPFTLSTLWVILPYSLPIALVGSLETLMTATIVDEMTQIPSDKNREIRGQGIANFITGFFGAMAGCAMIGQTVIHVSSGGRKRLSTFVAGSLLLVLIVVLTPAKVPIAARAGVMFTVSRSSVTTLRPFPARARSPWDLSRDNVAAQRPQRPSDNAAQPRRP